MWLTALQRPRLPASYVASLLWRLFHSITNRLSADSIRYIVLLRWYCHEDILGTFPAPARLAEDLQTELQLLLQLQSQRSRGCVELWDCKYEICTGIIYVNLDLIWTPKFYACSQGRVLDLGTGSGVAWQREWRARWQAEHTSPSWQLIRNNHIYTHTVTGHGYTHTHMYIYMHIFVYTIHMISICREWRCT